MLLRLVPGGGFLKNQPWNIWLLVLAGVARRSSAPPTEAQLRAVGAGSVVVLGLFTLLRKLMLAQCSSI